MRHVIPLSIFAVFFMVLPATLAAHGLGSFFEVPKEGHTIDVGYDPAVMRSGISERFDFGILEPKTKLPQDFESVWVRIVKGKTTLFATGIARADLGPTTLLYTFDSPGSYSLELSYRDGEKEIVNASIPLTVVKGEGASPYVLPVLALMGGVLLGALVCYLLLARRRS